MAKQRKQQESAEQRAATEQLWFGMSFRKEMAELETKALSSVLEKRHASHLRIYEAGLRAIGVSPEELERLHRVENRALDELARKQTAVAHRYAKALRAKQKAQLRSIIRHKKNFEWTSGNPTYLTCLWLADSVTTLPVVSGPTETIETRTGVGDNTCRFRDSVTGTATSGILHTTHRSTLYKFRYTAAHDGMLHGVSMLQVAGTFEVKAPFVCFGTSKAKATGTAMLSATFPGGTGSVTIHSPRQEFLNESVSESSGGVVVGVPVPIDTGQVSLDVGPFLIRRGQTVALTVSVETTISAKFSGMAKIDVGSDPTFGMNVPTVWVGLDT